MVGQRRAFHHRAQELTDDFLVGDAWHVLVISIPQYHYCGASKTVLSLSESSDFLSASGLSENGSLYIVDMGLSPICPPSESYSFSLPSLRMESLRSPLEDGFFPLPSVATNPAAQRPLHTLSFGTRTHTFVVVGGFVPLGTWRGAEVSCRQLKYNLAGARTRTTIDRGFILGLWMGSFRGAVFGQRPLHR